MKSYHFVSIEYDGTGKVPAFRFVGSVRTKNGFYGVNVKQSADSHVSIDLTGDDSHRLFLLPGKFVAIQGEGRHYTKAEFLKSSKLSASDFYELSAIINREAVKLFGLKTSANIPACLSALRGEPIVDDLRIALDEKLGPMLVELGIRRDKIMKIYDSAVDVYLRAGLV